MRRIVVAGCLVAAFAGCAMDSVGSVSAPSVVPESCSALAFGTLPAGDSYDGDATALDGITGGDWLHLTPERSVTVCGGGCDRHPGWCIGRGHFEHGSGRGVGHARHDHDHDCTTTTERDTFVGSVDSLDCVINGASNATISGTGTWNGAGDHTFIAFVSDDSDETTDFYSIAIYDSTDTLVYTTSGIPDSGDIVVVDLGP